MDHRYSRQSSPMLLVHGGENKRWSLTLTRNDEQWEINKVMWHVFETKLRQIYLQPHYPLCHGCSVPCSCRNLWRKVVDFIENGEISLCVLSSISAAFFDVFCSAPLRFRDASDASPSSCLFFLIFYFLTNSFLKTRMHYNYDNAHRYLHWTPKHPRHVPLSQKSPRPIQSQQSP